MGYIRVNRLDKNLTHPYLTELTKTEPSKRNCKMENSLVTTGCGLDTHLGDGKKLESPNEFFLTLENCKVGHSVILALLRDGKTVQANVTLEAGP
jgi:hypothetical protein